ncbi:dienelactone hydrolase family protein [Actinomadura sp. HBU206391]|uniref:dienelactone hydrolase family protein n=1 Tax=Actinomadura sp. HBU206391 TaxID=2731692 RepID=UPI00164F7B23|nr:dienelactone hydrolase family protein [Actinomadura sp. HBU206391]MBC6463806.1 dienelactone hydrolase family protein [Actinomadura sp. HBU206391]
MTAPVIETTDGPMPTLIGRPSTPPRGAVIVIQEAFGLTGHIQSVCDRLAEAGWLALAPGIYHRDGNVTFDYADLPPALEVMNRLNPSGLSTDLEATYGHLESEGFTAERIGIVGFCMGGAISMWAGTGDRVAAVVTWYGGGVAKGRFGLPPLIDLAPSLNRPWLGLYGDLDHSIDPADVTRLGESVNSAPVTTELIRYPDAGHGFNCDDRADHYQPRAAADAWTRMLAWFERYVGKETS